MSLKIFKEVVSMNKQAGKGVRLSFGSYIFLLVIFGFALSYLFFAVEFPGPFAKVMMYLCAMIPAASIVFMIGLGKYYSLKKEYKNLSRSTGKVISELSHFIGNRAIEVITRRNLHYNEAEKREFWEMYLVYESKGLRVLTEKKNDLTDRIIEVATMTIDIDDKSGNILELRVGKTIISRPLGDIEKIVKDIDRLFSEYRLPEKGEAAQ